MKTQRMKLVECGVSEHEDFLSMVEAGTTQIGVIEKRGGTAFLGCGVVRLAGEKGGDALAVEDAQFERAGRDRFEPRRVQTAIRAQNAQAGAKPLFGVRPAGEHGADQAFGVGSDLAGPAAEPIRRPLGVIPVGTRHVVGLRAVLAAHVAALVDRYSLAAMEHLDCARGDANLDLGANQSVRNRVEEIMDLDVIIEVDSRAPPLRELPILGWQAVERGAFDLLEQLAPAQSEMAHRTLVHALHDEFDGLVAFGERGEGLCAQSAEDIGLSKSDSSLDLGLVSWLVRPRRKDSNRVVRRHRAIGSVDLWIVERGFVDAALQIVGNQQLRRAAEEAEHANVRAGPIRQLLRPRSLGISQVRSAENSNKYLSLMDLARRWINNRDPLARVVHERLFSGDVVLGHHGAQPGLEHAEQIAEPAVDRAHP